MNVIILIGRLVRDPELRYTQDGIAVANFTLAVDGYKKDDTDFIKVVVWRKLAEACTEYLEKGRLVAVKGQLKIRKYEDKDGNNRISPEVVANSIKFLEKSNKGYDGYDDIGDEDVLF